MVVWIIEYTDPTLGTPELIAELLILQRWKLPMESTHFPDSIVFLLI